MDAIMDTMRAVIVLVFVMLGSSCVGSRQGPVEAPSAAEEAGMCLEPPPEEPEPEPCE